MVSINSCRCCLLRAPDRNLKTPYAHLGNEEIYENMLKECFNIHLIQDGDQCGICEPCVARLRDATAFKLQVQHSQMELQKWRERACQVRDEEPTVKLEVVDDIGTTDDMEYEEPLPLLKVEVEEENGIVEVMLCEERPIKLEVEVVRTSEDSTLGEQPVKSEVSDHDSKEDCMSLAFTETMIVRPRVDEAPHTSHAHQDTKRPSHIKKMPNITVNTCVEKNKKTPSNKLKRSILGPRSQSCTTCRKGFTKKSHLDRHMIIHTGEKSFSCDICNKQFGRKSTLINHKRIHTGDKPYACEICKRQFRDKTALRNHDRSHTGEKPFECRVCNKQFTQKSHLISHIRIHEGVKPYSCEICNKEFTEQYTLTKHIRIHTGDKPYSCDVCDKKFRQKGYLRTHKLTHTGNKPYSCDYCKKTFAQKSHVKDHIRIHERKPYCCEICSKNFVDCTRLKLHKLIHSSDKP